MPEMYNGDRYWDYPEVEAWCRALAAEEDWISLETIGVTREGRSIVLLTLGENPSTTPAMWLDAGTHASEFTGVMSVVFSLSRWVEWARGTLGKQWFKQQTIFVCPCIP